jgi:phage terminase large subunit-like protein
MLFLVPIGFDDPVLCSRTKCTMASAASTIGRKKCSAKNRVKVGWFTENPPHIHSTIPFPRIGMAEKMFVMTVAPQKDICPQGRT